MEILNLTQHPASPEQIADGVVEPLDKSYVQRLLTFDDLPDSGHLKIRAKNLVELAQFLGASSVMIGGAPYLMGTLERALLAAGIKPLYAFSARESVETAQPDGSVKKVVVFKHLGFVEVEA